MKRFAATLNLPGEYCSQTPVPTSGPLFLTIKGRRIYPRAVQRIVEKKLVEHTEAVRHHPMHFATRFFATHLLGQRCGYRG